MKEFAADTAPVPLEFVVAAGAGQMQQDSAKTGLSEVSLHNVLKGCGRAKRPGGWNPCLAFGGTVSERVLLGPSVESTTSNPTPLKPPQG